MFKITEINNEVKLYNNYTGYNVPYIENIIYGDFPNCEAQVKTTDMRLEKYIIYISNAMNDYKIEFQKSVLWHEFTHINDYIKFKVDFPNCIDEILKTFSESNAESIKIRYLLHIPFNKIIGSERRILLDKDKEKSLDVIASFYIEHSIKIFKEFTSDKDPCTFNLGMSCFCYACGYFSLLKEPIKSKLCSHMISEHPEIYRQDLFSLYNAIQSTDVNRCGTIYKKMKLDAMKVSIDINL